MDYMHITYELYAYVRSPPWKQPVSSRFPHDEARYTYEEEDPEYTPMQKFLHGMILGVLWIFLRNVNPVGRYHFEVFPVLSFEPNIPSTT